MSTKELQENIVENMKKWQRIEDASVASTGNVMSKTQNPILRQIMEIIQRDSLMHYRIQGMIADSFSQTVSLNPDDLAEVWDLIENHINIEKKTIEMANSALDAMQGKKMVIQEYLLNYLKIDEEKHDKLLESLTMIQKGMYPYG